MSKNKIRNKNDVVVLEIDERSSKVLNVECKGCPALADGCKYATRIPNVGTSKK